MAMPTAIMLAQIDAGVFVWSAVLIVIVIALFGVVVWVRRRLSPNEDFHGEGFTLGDLRRLHQAGKLSTEEYEKAKAGIIAAAQAAGRRKEEEKKNLRDFGVDRM
jgi:hypothetical protein